VPHMSRYPSFMALLVVLIAVLSGCEQEPGGSCPLGPGRCDTPPGEDPSPSQGWSFTSDTSTFRIGHTATRLPDGKVLVVGGVNPRPQQEQKATAELYDPGTGTWSSTGSLAAGRTEHTATLLPNGKVLVVGGVSVIDDSQETPLPLLVSAELYDPKTGTWSSTGSLAVGRLFHTATLLPNGKVLVVGGGGDATSSPAELYDPEAGTWSLTDIPAQARIWHTATLLPNGKVLVTGGFGLLNTAEVYDPGTDTWSPTNSPALGRDRHTATLLQSGKVLVVGGSTLGVNVYNSTAELYDPETGTWSPTGSLGTGRNGHKATLLQSGKVLVVGGNDDAESLGLVTAEVYDPGTGTWSPTGSLLTARAYPTATLLLSGKVLVVGGTGIPTAELYTP